MEGRINYMVGNSLEQTENEELKGKGDIGE